MLLTRPLVETSEIIAKRAGRVDGQLRRAGDRVASGDLIVGATGVVYGEPVVTRHVGDFERIPECEVQTY